MAASRSIRCPARLVWLVIVALLTVVGVVTLPSAAGAQDDARGEQPEITVRIAAQRIADGRTEFALQQRQADDSWGARLLPTRRFFPAAARVGRWLVSTPLSLSVETAAGEAPATGVEVRIVARRGSDNRIEFALQRHEADESWSEPLLPTRRFFPAAARVGRWLFSTPLSVWESQPPPSTGAATRFTAIAAGSDYSCGLRSDGGIECWGWTGERTGDPPGGVYRRRRGQRTRVRDPSQPHGGLLGQQRPRAGDGTIGPVHRTIRCPRSNVRATHQRHGPVLGPGR